jgi:hypothetical protein
LRAWGLLVLDLERPPAVGAALEAGHLLREFDREAVLAAEVVQQVGGERAVVHVGARHHARGGDRLRGIAALHDQRRPFADLLVVLGIFHAAVAVMRAHRGMTLLQESLAVGADHEAHVRHGMDEGVRPLDRALGDQVRPELPRHVELDIDLERAGDVDAAVRALRRVVQLAVGGVTGARVVPGTRTLLRLGFQPLEDLDPEMRLQLLEEGGQRHAHDAGADQHDVEVASVIVCHGTLLAVVGPSGGRPVWRA